MEETKTVRLIPARAPKKVVVQHNALAEARYRLSVRAQKLLIRLLAELDHRSEAFIDIKLYLRDFAKLASGDPGDVVFTEFIDAAKQFMGRFVSITQPPAPGEKEPRGLICHWISSIEKNPNEKSITFSFDPKLRPYLLGLHRNFFAYHTLHALNLDSGYAIRLYQWAKSREFMRRPQRVSVEDLRYFLGTSEVDAEGQVIKQSLKRYNDFKKVALQPAVREINKKTDITIAFQEIKQPGTKIICAILFSISIKEGAQPALMEAEFRAQPELCLENQSPDDSQNEAANIVEYVKSTYQLNDEQVSKIHGYIAKNGLEYVREKIAVTELQPRENVARFLLAALRDDYKLPVRHVPAKKVKPKIPPSPEPEFTEEDRQRAQLALAEWKRNFARGAAETRK
jgi:plasmid replication initiation protein